MRQWLDRLFLALMGGLVAAVTVVGLQTYFHTPREQLIISGQWCFDIAGIRTPHGTIMFDDSEYSSVYVTWRGPGHLPVKATAIHRDNSVCYPPFQEGIEAISHFAYEAAAEQGRIPHRRVLVDDDGNRVDYYPGT